MMNIMFSIVCRGCLLRSIGSITKGDVVHILILLRVQLILVYSAIFLTFQKYISTGH